MTFRADEAAEGGYEKTKKYLIPRSFTSDQRGKAEQALAKIVSDYGPVVDSYPTWHPLVAQHDEQPVTEPSDRCGYLGLDHTRFFANAFITCPYTDGQAVIDSAENLIAPQGVTIRAERLDVPFYNEGATPILVTCDWSGRLEAGHTVPKRLAVPLMLEKEVPVWRWSSRGETWETMRPYLLGEPHGSRSSLFVSQETALAIKKIYVALLDSGMFGSAHAR
jgi:hypothetical protein